MKKKMRNVEYIRIWENKTWDTAFFDIPCEIEEPEKMIEYIESEIEYLNPEILMIQIYHYEE